MSNFTERLLQAAAIVTLLYFGWSLAAQTVVQIINLNNRLANCEQQLQQAKAPPPAPKAP